MRNVSRGFLKAGFIIGIVVAVLFIILGVLFVAVGKATIDSEFLKSFQEIINQYFKGEVKAFQNFALATGLAFIVVALFSIASSVFCLIARGKPKVANLVLAIVLCALGGSIFGLLGGIFGLIANGQENNKPVDAQ